MPIIMVPSAVTGTSIPVFDPVGVGSSRLSAVLPQSITRDPMEDHYLWYCRFGTEGMISSFECEIRDTEIRYRLWDRQQIENWIVENCSKPVLVQRRPHNHSWRFVFTGGERDEFRNWFYQQRMEHFFEVPDSDHMAIVEWLRSLKGDYLTKHDPCLETLNVFIRDAGEAALFKLRWVHL